MGVTNTPAGSPSAGDEEVDEIADKPIVADPVSSTGTDANAASSAEPSDAVGDRDAEKQPTALDALKAKLVKPEPADSEPAEVADEVPAEEPVAGEVDEAAATATDETPPEDTAEVDDGLHGFSEREITHPSNKGMVARIRDLAKRVKTSEQNVREAEPIKERGEFLRDFEAQQGLEPEEVVAALHLSAAFKRGDPKALESLDAAAAQLRADLGLPDPVAAAPAAVEPFQGVLPQEYADMVSALGIPEADVRLMLALLKQHKAPKLATPPAAVRPAPRPLARPAAAAPDAAYQARIATAANETVLEYLETQKVPKAKAREHVEKHLSKYLAPLAPGGQISRIPPEDRLRLTKIAQQKHILAVAKVRAAARAQAPPVLSTSTSAAPASSTSKPKTDLDKLKARMVAKR